jgi:hypothetical protein
MSNLIPQSIQGGMTYQILDQWSAMMEDKSATLYFPFGDQNARTITAIRNGIGQLQQIKQARWSWFEEDRAQVPFTVESVTNASGVYTITIPSDEVDPATGNSWPNKFDVFQHVESGRNFYISDKPAADELVVKPVNNTGANLISIVAGDTFFYIGQVSKEGSTEVIPKFYFSTEYTVGTQIVRHNEQSTGSALFNQLWYDQLQSRVSIPYSNSQDVMKLQRIHNLAFVNSFFANELSNNLSAAENFNTTSATEGMYNGLYKTIFGRGQKQDTGGTPGVSDFYALEALLSQQDSSIRSYSVWTGGAVYSQVSQAMLEYLKQTYVDTTVQEYRDLFYNGSLDTNSMRTTLDFQYMTFQGKNFGLSRIDILDNPTTFNAGSGLQTTKPWQNVAFFIPLGNGADDGNGNLGKYVRICHKGDTTSRFMKMWYTGAMSPNGNQTAEDTLRIDILSEYTLGFLMANNYGMFYKA